MATIFSGKREYPYHLSVGALLIKDGKVLCHRYETSDLPYESEGKGEFLYLLMRETPHEGESIETSVMRGIMEEFGAMGTIRHYLGAVESWFPGVTTGVPIYKTTLYFLVDVDSFDPTLRPKDAVESKSEILVIEPQKLLALMREQGARYERTDLNECGVIERFLTL